MEPRTKLTHSFDSTSNCCERNVFSLASVLFISSRDCTFLAEALALGLRPCDIASFFPIDDESLSWGDGRRV
jgi:hypothetical protein